MALDLSKEHINAKPIEPQVVYLPTIKLLNVKGVEESTVFHICKPLKLVEALRSVDTLKALQCMEIWKKWCGILFPQASDKMFCSKCFKEFDASLHKKLSIVRVAGKLNL